MSRPCCICKTFECKPRRVTCGRTCHAALVRRQHTGKTWAAGPRSKVCPVCNRTFSRAFPSALARTTHCSRRCLARTQKERTAKRRLGVWQQKFPELSVREIELMRYAYQLGYARRANRERIALAKAS